jgi:hypothetical protein
LPPSEIPGPGIFTTAIHRTVVVVRLPNLTDAERWAAMRALPDGGPLGPLGVAVVEQPTVTPAVLLAAPASAMSDPGAALRLDLSVTPAEPAAEQRDMPLASDPVTAPEQPVPPLLVPDDPERLAYALFLIETQREGDRVNALERAKQRLHASEEDRLAYAIYLMETKQVDGVSRAVERSWNVKRGGAEKFQGPKRLVESAMAHRPRAMAAATA